MRLALFLLAGAALFSLASFLAVLSYGHFAFRARGDTTTALPTSPSDTGLDREMEPRVAAHGGRSGLTMLAGNLDAFAARALAARAAGRSLDLMYYYWRDDLTGNLLAHEIVAAADRGVRVRLLLDDINASGRDRAYLALDAHPNISVRLFNPSRARSPGIRRGIEMALRVFSVMRRMHNKAWIADGRLAIVGGRNIGDAYFDAAETSNFRDIDLLLTGPVVAETEAVFDAYWNSEVAMPIRALARRRGGTLEQQRAGLDDREQSEAARPYLERANERISVFAMMDGALATHWTSEAKIVSDPPEKAVGRGAENWIMSALMPVIASAENRVEITSPYFVPGKGGIERLKRMRDAGIDVAVLTNSLAATDVAAVHGGYAPYRRALLQAGVRLYELQPYRHRRRISLMGSRGASLHTKAFTVDRRAGFVGSFNFDPRSVSLNTEMGVLFADEGLAEEIRRQFAEDTGPHTSYRVLLAADGSLRWLCADDDGNERVWTHEPQASLARRTVARLIGWLPIESQL